MYLFKFTSISHLDSTGELGENSQSSNEIMVFKWSLEAAVAYELSSTEKTLPKKVSSAQDSYPGIKKLKLPNTE